MEVLFFRNFSKRDNSTKQPNDENGELREVRLKGQCDVRSPMFFLTGCDDYVYCKAWNMYYFIHRIGYDIDGAQYVYCNIDYLATWKAQIMASNAFVKYSSSNYSSLLIDDRVGMLSDIDIKVDDSEPSLFTTTPSYILTVVGEGGVECIIPTDPNIIPATLYQKTATDLISALCIQWSDAQSCMLELLEIPIAVGADYQANPAYVGKIDVGSRACKNQYFNELREELTTVLHIPESYKDFRLFTFVNLFLYLPMVGVVELDLHDFAPDPTALNRQVIINAVANVMTGQISYSLKNKEGVVVSTYTGTFGRKLPINASSPRDVIGAVTHLASAAADIGSGNKSGAFGEIVKSMTSSVHFKGSVIGSFGGGFGEYLGTNYMLALCEHKSRIEPSNLTDLIGRPCAKVLNLSELTGYVETVGFSIDIVALDADRQAINRLMDNGVYLE